jgi:type IV pilus assembly protein PilC
MALMLSSKVNMLRAITLVKQMIRFYPIEITLSAVERDIMKGVPLSKSLASFSIYPSKMIALIKAGEEVNKVDYFLKTLNQQFSEEIDHQSAILGSMIEPFIIIFLGIIVGVILIAMYLPLFHLSQTF